MDHAGEVRQAFDQAETLFPWPMFDIRAPEWYSGRMALCGDSGVAFLPTAGVGASNAAALGGGAGRRAVESRCAARAARLGAMGQTLPPLHRGQSGRLPRGRAAYMFVESPALGWLRDQLVKLYPARRLLRQIIESMRQPF